MQKQFTNSLLILTLLILLPSLPVRAQSRTITPEEEPLSVHQAVQAEIFRYAREMYRIGNYPEAVSAFVRILRINCRNAVAQYHLQQIAQEVPGQTIAETSLKNLPCPQYDFADNDYLPAALYYETDSDLLKDQLNDYNRRYRTAREIMRANIDKYAAQVKDLEKQIAALPKIITPQMPLPATAAFAPDNSDQIKTLKQTASALEAKVRELNTRLETGHIPAPAVMPVSDTPDTADHTGDNRIAALLQRIQQIQARLDRIQEVVSSQNQSIDTLGRAMLPSQE